MAAHDPQNEARWQLPANGSEQAPALTKKAEAGVDAREERLSVSARFAGLLAGADVTAIVTCEEQEMVVGFVDPLTPWLQVGARLRLNEHLGAAANNAVMALLSGRQAWLECLPPEGFRSSVLVAAPSLARSRRLVLAASLFKPFEKRNLGVAALYLARGHHIGMRQGKPGNARVVAAA